MDANTLKGFLPELQRFTARFQDCFSDRRSRDHLPVYLRGQLSDLDRKSIEPIALAAGVAPRTLQEFLSSLSWDTSGCAIGFSRSSRPSIAVAQRWV